MSKPGRGREGTSRRRRKKRVWQGILALLVLGGLASSWYLVSGGGETTGSQPLSAEPAATPRESLPPSLQNRMVLPAAPKTLRPFTLSPESYASNSNPEIYTAYKAARDVPEVLEHMPCYCGCFGSSGHRNNLDCYTDNHGVT